MGGATSTGATLASGMDASIMSSAEAETGCAEPRKSCITGHSSDVGAGAEPGVRAGPCTADLGVARAGACVLGGVDC